MCARATANTALSLHVHSNCVFAASKLTRVVASCEGPAAAEATRLSTNLAASHARASHPTRSTCRAAAAVAAAGPT